MSSCSSDSTAQGPAPWRGDTELNASFWDREHARALREDLFGEHLGGEQSGAGARDAFTHFAATARANAVRLREGKPLVGLAHAIDPATWVD